MRKYFALFAVPAILALMATSVLSGACIYDSELGQTDTLPGEGSNERNEEIWLENLLSLAYDSNDVTLVTKFDGKDNVESFLYAGYPSWDYAILKQAGTWTAYWDCNSNDILDIAPQDISHITLFRADEAPPPIIAIPGTPVVWHNWFAVDALETPMVGDFNGDGMTDIITFTRDNPDAVGDVYVALSEGDRFGSSTKWHDWFAINQDETVVIGDFNGDGMDDIATWLCKSSRQVYVATSYGYGMNEPVVWVNSIGEDPSDVLRAGDVDGDGKDDLIGFYQGEGKVYVLLSP